MRRNAATIALVVTCSALLCTGSLLAKPTRTLTRTSARRIIIAQPLRHPTRQLSGEESGRVHTLIHEGVVETGAHHRTAKHMAYVTAIHTSRSERMAQSGHSSKLPPRTRTLPHEQVLAGQGKYHADDRLSAHIGVATRSRTIRTRSTGDGVDTAADINSGAPSDTFGRQSEAAESTKGSDELLSKSDAFLTNVGGALRPADDELPLKSIGDEAAHSVLPPSLRLSFLYDGEGRLIMPRPLYGSRDILLHQNEMADRDGLNRIQGDSDVLDLRRQKKLVPLPESEALRTDFRLPEDRRYTRPWTAAFLTVLAGDFYATFHMPLQVDSAVRTIAVQQRLLRTNGNAAPTSGDTASPHLTGQAVDIAKGGLTRMEIAWMRMYLQPLIDRGKIDVEEEFQQSCFHISVYRSFPSTSPAHLSIAATRQPLASTMAEGPSY